jgi:hypothetical protein
MIRRTNHQPAARRTAEDIAVNAITGIVCTANTGLARDKTRSLVRHYYRKGLRDVSQIGFMISLSPEKPLRLSDAQRLETRRQHPGDGLPPGKDNLARPLGDEPHTSTDLGL